MCGRLFQTSDPARIAALFGTSGAVPNYPPRHNGAPTQEIAAVRFNEADGARHLDLLRWGLVPHWAKDPAIGNRLINARAEGIDAKPAFRDAFRRRRCLVPADGFYEWQRRDDGRQPFAIALADGGPMALAGLWENWRDPAGNWVRSFTIVTTVANRLLAPIHDRMPVILDPADWPDWLGETAAAPERLLGLLRPLPADRLEAWPVSRRVNNVRADEPGLADRLPPANPA